MKLFSFLLFWIFHKILSLIPFRGLYVISDVSAFLLQFIFRYRYNTVKKNLQRAFPEKSDREIKWIIRQFYKNLCDVFLESIKGYSLSTEKLLQRYRCLNPEITFKYYMKGQDVIIALSHYGNWEWGTQVASIYFKHSVVAFYKPISNKYIDRFIFQNRKKHNMDMESIYKAKIISRSRKDKPKAYFFVSDQSPNRRKAAYWLKFLNQDTACMQGIESYARLFDLPVFYLDVQRLSRGYYTIKLEVICSTHLETSAGHITRGYMQKLETIIEQKPEDWLWSHRRWKMKEPELNSS